MNSLSGCLLINKKAGSTSRQEVNAVSKALHEKKCGHIGTLDPFATGLLIVLVGRATKISSLLEQKDKTYVATLRLGIKTDSGDKDGNIIETRNIPIIDENKIKSVLQSFLGESEQLPPMYSALKKDGKHYYDYARKGIEIEREKRKINIFDIRLIEFHGDYITFIAKVSKGTYIRTLGEDIAEKLGTVGHLVELQRIAIGKYLLKDALDSEKVTADALVSIEKMLSDMPSITLEGKDAFKALNGVALKLNSNEDQILVKDKDGIIAIYSKNNDVYSCLRGLRWRLFKYIQSK